MGYYTSHELEIVSGNDDIDHEEGISSTTDYEYGCFDDTIKWYNREEDMRKYSKLYPETIFKLSGDGEESGDMWHEYYQNGKMQKCKAIITFESLDLTKLK